MKCVCIHRLTPEDGIDGKFLACFEGEENGLKATGNTADEATIRLLGGRIEELEKVKVEPSKFDLPDVWLKAWCACASGSNTTLKEVASDWADACLQDFKKRFIK